MHVTRPVPPVAEPSGSFAPLLPLKLATPVLRIDAVPRPDLHALLAEARLHQVTLLVAPAGYGKTTLLAQWCATLAQTGGRWCWLGLDSGDRSPAMFLAYLISAFQTTFPEFGAEARRMLQRASNLDHDWPLVASALCSNLQHHVHSALFLILDDLHAVSDVGTITQILGYLLRAMPSTLHVVLASRRAPVFAPLVRLRAENRLLDILPEHFNLSLEETSALLATQNVHLDHGDLAALHATTAGWAMSVQLAGRALAGVPAAKRRDFVQHLAAHQQDVFSFLAAEVLADLPADITDFLQQAALPRVFSAEVLDHALGRDDALFTLQHAQSFGLPLLALDDTGNQMRFHPLWREVLRHQLRTVTTPQHVQQLHQRYGQAFETVGDLAAALEHYADADATEDVIRTLRVRSWPLMASHRDLIRQWIERLDPVVRDHDAELLHIWGVSQVVSASDQAVAALERALALYIQQGRADRALRALADLALVQAWQVDLGKVRRICLRAIRLARHIHDPWADGTVQACTSAALALRGRFEQALLLANQIDTGYLNHQWRWLLAAILAGVCCRLGRPQQALLIISVALDSPQIESNDRVRLELLRLRADALFQQGDIVGATTLSQDVYEQLGNYPRGGMFGLCAAQHALLLGLQGQFEQAETVLAHARAAWQDHPDAEYQLAELRVIEVMIWAQRGHLLDLATTVLPLFGQIQAQPVPNWTFGLILALVLGEHGETQAAAALLGPTVDGMTRAGYRGFLATALLYAASLASDQQHQHDMYAQGWALAEAEHMPFLPLLPPRATLAALTYALQHQLAPTTAGLLLRHQLPDDTPALLQGLLGDGEAAVRRTAATLIGQLVINSAFPALRPLLKDRDAGVRFAAEHALKQLVYRPAYQLQINTLGAFQVSRGNEVIADREWRSSKARQLFQLLVTERGRVLSRERLQETLWPSLNSEAAYNNLRVTLNRMIKALEPNRPEGAPVAYLVQQGETYGFNLNADYVLDVEQFAIAVAGGQRAIRMNQHQVALDMLQRAVELYRGQYLPDALYDDWTQVERERLMMLFANAALELGDMLLRQAQPYEAIGLAWRVLEHDRTDERAYQLLIRAHADLGERTTALRLYNRCVTELRSELGIDPLPETVALLHFLRDET